MSADIHNSILRAIDRGDLSAGGGHLYQEVLDKCGDWRSLERSGPLTHDYYMGMALFRAGILDRRLLAQHINGEFTGHLVEFKRAEGLA